MAYTFDQIFAADPSNPGNVASNGAVTIFAPGDPAQTPLAITDVSGNPMLNPVTVNAFGFGAAFMHATLDRVAWSGGGFSGFFTSYEGMKSEAVAARSAAEAAADAAAASAADADEVKDLAQAPTDAQVAEALRKAVRPSGLALAPDGIPYVEEGANDTSVYRAADGNFYFNNL